MKGLVATVSGGRDRDGPPPRGWVRDRGRPHDRRGWSVGLLVGGLTLFGTHPTWAAPGDRFDDPATAIPISPPGPLPFLGPPEDIERQEAGPKVLFVNFEGEKMRSCGGSNAPPDNCSTIFDGTVMPYSGSSTMRAAIIQTVRGNLSPFDITVTDVRPTEGDYDMAMVGNWDPEPEGNFAGVAPGIDCWDMDGGQTSFSLEYTSTSDGMAEVILQEIAHTWGLSHVSDLTDLLFPTTQGQGKTFVDECLEIVEDATLTPGTSACSHHVDACESDALQNSHAELLMIFGAGRMDTTPPTLAIKQPKHDAVYKWPEDRAFDLDIVLDLDDDNQPTLFTVYMRLKSDALPEIAQIQFRIGGPTEHIQPMTNLPYGEYSLVVEIQDEAGLVATSVVDFSVVEGEPDVDDGCECSHGDDQRVSPWWLFLPLVLSPVRRRVTP